MKRRALALHLAVPCALALGCGASAPQPAPTAAAPSTPAVPARQVPNPIVVGDQRPEQERAMDARVGQANSSMHGALREAALECASAPEAERHLCTRRHREASSKAAQERIDRRFAAMRAVGEAVEACEVHASEAAREACADAIDTPDTGPSDNELHTAINWRWARQTYGCARTPSPRSVPCESIATLTGTQAAAIEPGRRFIGAAVVRTYMEHEHHDLLAVELRTVGETTQVCAMPIHDSQQATIEATLRELFSGRAAPDNAARQSALAHSFADGECKRVRVDGNGRWTSTDGRWLLGASDRGFAFRARDWGPQSAFLLAELSELAAR